MVNRANIQVDLIKLASGERVIRLTEPASGLTLEKKLDPHKSVARQKDSLFVALETALAKSALAVG